MRSSNIFDPIPVCSKQVVLSVTKPPVYWFVLLVDCIQKTGSIGQTRMFTE
jgi:hypothetical protein